MVTKYLEKELLQDGENDPNCSDFCHIQGYVCYVPLLGPWEPIKSYHECKVLVRFGSIFLHKIDICGAKEYMNKFKITCCDCYIV